jgi:hypothetical protein
MTTRCQIRPWAQRESGRGTTPAFAGRLATCGPYLITSTATTALNHRSSLDPAATAHCSCLERERERERSILTQSTMQAMLAHPSVPAVGCARVIVCARH